VLLLTRSCHCQHNVAALCRSGFYHLRQVRPLLRSLTHEAARTLQAFISSRLDYCNSLLYGLPQSLIGKVQSADSAQNAAARLLTGTRRGDHISPVLRQLHWLPVQTRVDFKLACFVYSSLSGQAPPYLADDIHWVSEGQLKTSTPLVHRQIVRCSTDAQHIRRQKLCFYMSLEQPPSTLSR